MSSTTNVDVLSAALNHTPEFTELAAQYGPFFFGVFLVLIAVALLFMDKNRAIVSWFSVCGVLFMVAATFLYSSRGDQIHAYTMSIDNLTKDDTLVVTDSVPRIYRHNRVYDTALDSFSVDLLTVSPVKLMEGVSFNIVIKRAITLLQSNGEEKVSHVKYTVPIRFKGTPQSKYTLQGIEDEEEGFSGFQIAKNVDSSNRRFAALQSFFISSAKAGELSARSDDEKNVEIIYFKSAIDKNKVVTALSDTGLKFGTTKSKMQKSANAVWIGINVPSDTVKMIGAAMLKHGIEIRYFGGFKNQYSKTNVIQIGYSSRNKNNNLVSQESVDSYIKKIEEQKYQEAQNRKKVIKFKRKFSSKLKMLQQKQQ